MNQSPSFNLERVTFYGRSLAEYERMFLLDFSERTGQSILDCPSGPASFSRQGRELGLRVRAVDPQFSRTPEELLAIATRDIDYVLSKIAETAHERKWDYYESLESLKKRQSEILHSFIEDYKADWPARTNYITASLPHLPFANNSFDLALSGHFLFSFHAHFPTTAIADSLLELARVAREVRVFPLRTNEQNRNMPFVDLEKITATLHQNGLIVRIEPSEFEFQIGANEVLIMEQS
ncbi:MAG: class I SAM-dependent methyltransferase [Cyanobacteria bacterium P01_E01_bin.42]